MSKPRPEPRPTSDALRRMMFVSWGELVRSGMLEDVDRAARLHAIVKDPYHETAFGDLSREDKMMMCANGLLENQEWQAAFRVLARLDRIEREKARLARQPGPRFPSRLMPDPEPEPEPEPEPDRGPPPALFGRRWSWAQLDDCVRRYPDLGRRPHAEILEIVASFPPAPDG